MQRMLFPLLSQTYKLLTPLYTVCLSFLGKILLRHGYRHGLVRRPTNFGIYIHPVTLTPLKSVHVQLIIITDINIVLTVMKPELHAYLPI